LLSSSQILTKYIINEQQKHELTNKINYDTAQFPLNNLNSQNLKYIALPSYRILKGTKIYYPFISQEKNKHK